MNSKTIRGPKSQLIPSQAEPATEQSTTDFFVENDSEDKSHSDDDSYLPEARDQSINHNDYIQVTLLCRPGLGQDAGCPLGLVVISDLFETLPVGCPDESSIMNYNCNFKGIGCRQI